MIALNNPKTKKKLVSQFKKALWTKAVAFGLVFIVSVSLLFMTYSSKSNAWSAVNSQASSEVASSPAYTAEWNMTEMGTTEASGANKLIFRDQQVLAFNVPNEYFPYDANYNYWHEYSFGSIVPSNATVALCMLKLTGIGPFGGSDISFSPQDPIAGETVAGKTGYSVGADSVWFDGTVFAYVAIQNGQVWACNPGNVCGVDVYVVGYVTEATDDRGFYFDFTTQDYSVVSGSATTTWTDIGVLSILPSHPGYNLIGLYIALDAPSTAVDVSFRAGGKTGDGMTWETCTNDPGTHLIGLIPASDSGFQYRASSDASISICVEGFIFSCPLADGDRFVCQISTPYTIRNVITNAWTRSPSCTSNVKAIITAPLQSPGAVNQYKCRAYGASNAQIWYKKNSCGCFCILTPLGEDKAFEYYWNSPTGDENGRMITFIGSMVLQAHS
jgi:hypothetical protein